MQRTSPRLSATMGQACQLSRIFGDDGQRWEAFRSDNLHPWWAEDELHHKCGRASMSWRSVERIPSKNMMSRILKKATGSMLGRPRSA
jgi:hypothetical protein